jgi:2-methylcitrate dehydratase PrpD
MGAIESAVARFAVEYPAADVPGEVTHLATRCVINFCGVALYASRDTGIDALLGIFAAEGAQPTATVIGRGMRTSGQHAALANGFLGHYDDFDDTHMSTTIHPTSPILPAALAAAEIKPASGRELLAAYAIGVEVACRVGRAVVAHRRSGAENWHPTSMFGVLGAAAAAGRLLGLTPDQLVQAFGIAGTQASGLRVSSGSMCKPLHAGKAAQNGLFAALAARAGLTASDSMLESPRGIVGVMTTELDVSPIASGLGQQWELPDNGFKPYACGIVTHGLIDAMLLARERGVRPEAVERIEGWVHEPSASLMATRHPSTGMRGKFSYYHAMAVGLVDGRALPGQFTDERANDPMVARIRDRIEVSADPALARDAAYATVTLTDGQTHRLEVEHQTGSPANPMTDAQVETKFRNLAEGVLPPGRVDEAVGALWGLAASPDAAALMPLLAA